MNTKRTLALAAALVMAFTLPALPAAGQADFTKIVSIGASFDNGFLDSCWVKHGQLDAWPLIFARQAGVSDTSFQQPIIGEPGLGSPGCQVLTSLAPTFSYKPSTGKGENLTLTRPYDNLAIPGYYAASVVYCTKAVTDPKDPLYAACSVSLIDLVLRGSGATVLQQAASLKPTFFFFGILGNEIMVPARAGWAVDGVTVISKEAYAASFKTIVDTMKAAQGGTGKGVAITIPDVSVLPYFTAVSPIIGVNPSTGAPIYVLGPTGCPTGYPACPVPAGTIVPLPLGALMKAGYGIPCAVAKLPACDNPLPDNPAVVSGTQFPGLLYPSEVSLLRSRAGEYNAQITSLATPAGYKVLDGAALLADIAAKGRTFGGMTLTTSYLSGGIFSYDGIHPSSIGNAVIADEVVKFVNANYGTTLPRVNMYNYLFNGNSQAGGFPIGALVSQQQIIDWAAAYFTPEVVEGMWSQLPLPSGRGVATVPVGDGEIEVPSPRQQAPIEEQ